MKLKRRTRVVPPAFTIVDDENGNISLGYITRASVDPRSKWRFFLHAGMSVTLDQLKEIIQLIDNQLGV